MIKQIQEVLNTQVNQALRLHKGGCKIVGFEDGVATVQLEGACVGCPSAKLTLYNFVVPVLQRNFAEIKEVVLDI